MDDDQGQPLSPPLPPDPSPAPPPPVGQQQQKSTAYQPPQDSTPGIASFINDGTTTMAAPPATVPSGLASMPPGSAEAPGMKRVDSLRSARPAVESPILQQRQPIKDAVNHAANDVFEHSPVTNQLDPEFIKQLTQQVTASVTEQVLQNLQAAGTTPTPSAPPPQTHFPPPPPPAQSSQEPRSPARSSIDSFPPRFTPPTPDLARDWREDAPSSPEPSPSDAGSSFSRASRDSGRSRESYRNAETPRAFYPDATEGRRRSSYTSRRRSGTGTSGSMDNESDITARNRSRRDSRGSEMSYDGTSRTRARPTRVPSDVEETPLERFWQPLFDNGNPTMRLGQFLRGLALHLIDDYEPKNSIVVTPAKMLRFLDETKIAEEHYPWDIIFGDKLSCISISMMYQKLLCQHHYIQERHDRPPTIPGLTPWGFDQFVTCLILAHPDSEYERIAKAVINMPISNADNKSERFPKELSKRLFPTQPSIPAQQRLTSSLSHEPYVLSLLKGATQMPPPPPPPPQSVPPTGQVPVQLNSGSMPAATAVPSGRSTVPPPSSFQERERKPYSQSSSSASNAFDDDDLAGPPPVQIERERKPYTAKEGEGKLYSQSSAPNAFDDDDLLTGPPPGQIERERKSYAAKERNGKYYSDSKSEAPPVRARSTRTNSGAPPPAMYNTNGRNGAFSKRRSSPPLRNPNARSEPDFAGNMPSREQYSADIDDDPLKRYRSRSRVDRPTAANGNDEDPRGYPIPGRNVPIANGYEYGSTPGSGPPIGQPAGSVPVGSFPSRRPTMGAYEDRRRSMYNPPTSSYGIGDGGTDGYGSFGPSQSYGSSAQH